MQPGAAESLELPFHEHQSTAITNLTFWEVFLRPPSEAR